MEASVSQDGAETTAAPEAPTGGQEAPTQQVAQLPPEVMQRLDEIGGFREELQPLLQNFQQQQQQEPEGQQGYEDFVDPETGYVLDPQGLQQYVDQQAEAKAQELMGPLRSRLDQHDQHFTQEAFADLTHQYPQLQDETFQASFVPRVEQAAGQIAQSMGLGPEAAQRLALNPQFVAQQYLAGLAREQAQQGVPAGDQGVHIEGGTGAPGQPERDAKQDWLDMAQRGNGGSPWGRDPGQL
jgi:hypothetical protein